MADLSKNVVLHNIPATATTVYTAPGGINSTVIHGLFVSNTDTSGQLTYTVTVQIVTGASNPTPGVTVIVLQSIPVPFQSTLELDKAINLYPTDVLQISASVASKLDMFASIVERS